MQYETLNGFFKRAGKRVLFLKNFVFFSKIMYVVEECRAVLITFSF